MTTKNDITGDSIQSKASGDAYRNGYDAIWGKKDKPSPNDPKTREAVTAWGKRMLEASEGFEHSGAYNEKEAPNE